MLSEPKDSKKWDSPKRWIAFLLSINGLLLAAFLTFTVMTYAKESTAAESVSNAANQVTMFMIKQMDVLNEMQKSSLKIESTVGSIESMVFKHDTLINRVIKNDIRQDEEINKIIEMGGIK